MRLTVTTFTSLDGVMQGPGGRDEDRSNGFGLGGWVVPFVDGEFGEIVDDIFSRAGEILLGRTTYETFYPYWSKLAGSDDIVANRLNNLPKHVATNSREVLEWKNSRVISGDVAAEIRRLKERPGGELQVHGSHGLIQMLLEEELVDAVNLLIFPVVLGEGKRLFDRGTVPTSLKLASSRVTGTGVIAATYEPTGTFEQGDFAIADGEVVVNQPGQPSPDDAPARRGSR